MDAYDDTIYSERLLGVKRACPECGATLRPTGNLKHFKLPGPSLWGIEYECPREHDVLVIRDQERDALIASVVREAGKA